MWFHSISARSAPPRQRSPPLGVDPASIRADFAWFLLDPHPIMLNMSLTRTEAVDIAAYIRVSHVLTDADGLQMSTRLPILAVLMRIVAAVLAGASLISTGVAQEIQLDRGRALVERMCAECHAVGPAGDSSHPNAPPFRRTWSFGHPNSSCADIGIGSVGLARHHDHAVGVRTRRSVMCSSSASCCMLS